MSVWGSFIRNKDSLLMAPTIDRGQRRKEKSPFPWIRRFENVDDPVDLAIAYLSRKQSA